jgi:predicted transcriptional regulator
MPPLRSPRASEGEYRATADELAGLERGLEEARQGRFATEEEVRAAFGTFRRA